MGLNQLLLVGVMVATIVLDHLNSRALAQVPEHEREVLDELLRPLWIGTALFVAVVVAELVRLWLGLRGYPASHIPVFLGFTASLVTNLIRRRAYRIYEVGANPELGRQLSVRAAWIFLLSTALWIGLAAYRF